MESTEADTVVEALRSSLHSGSSSLSTVPGLLSRILREGMWRSRVIKRTGEVAEFECFADFVTTPPLEGLGASVDDLRKAVRDDSEATRLLADVYDGKPLGVHGGSRGDAEPDSTLSDNVGRQGTDAAYLTRRIQRDAPDVFERMKAGEFQSVRKAAIAAGIVKVPSAIDALRRAWRKCSDDEREQFLREVMLASGAH